MRILFRFIQSIFLTAILASMVSAQNPIPNPGFENWTQGNPDGWVAPNVPGVYATITQSNNSYSGNSSVQGEVIQYAQVNIPPALIAEAGLLPISQSFTRMTGYYQMANQGEDALFIEVLFYDAQSAPVALGLAELGPTSGGYQMFTVDMDYSFGNQQPAAYAYILIAISLSSSATGDDITLGSSFLLDDIAFDMASSTVDQEAAGTPYVFALGQNYPNPFNPATTITFSLPSAGNTVLTVYNNLGQMVKTLINENLAAGVHQVSFDAATLPSGIYYYKLEAGTNSSIKRMMLVR